MMSLDKQHQSLPQTFVNMTGGVIKHQQSRQHVVWKDVSFSK